ncbi:MAG: lysylphosphatidylglycerol synthase transmembrane domain-containing protein [Planctomycetota bacterium]
MKRWLVPVLAATVLVAVVIGVADLQFEDVRGPLTHLDPLLCVAALGAYAFSYVGRGARLLAMMPGSRGLVHMTSICARHIFLAVILPFRTGEAALPVMLNREAGRTISEALAVLALMRVLDLLAVAGYLLVGLAFTMETGGDVGTRAALVAGGLGAGLLIMRPVCARLAVLRSSVHKPLAFVGQTAGYVAALSTRQLAAAVLTTAVTWLCIYGACYLVLRAMAGPQALPGLAGVSFAQSLVGTTGLHLAAVMPVSPVASVGTWEAGWAAGYSLVGVEKTPAGASAIVSHVVIFAYIVAIGGLAFLVRGRAARGPEQPAA